MITYKFPLYPNQEQQVLLWKHSHLQTQLYNRFIELEQKTYEETKQHLSGFKLCYLLPQIKEEEPEYKTIFSQTLQRVPMRVDEAYKIFFANPGKAKPPRTRSFNKFYNVEYPQPNVGYKLLNNQFVTKIYGTIEFNMYREIKGNIKTVEITHDSRTNKFYICIVTDYNRKVEQPYYGKHIGIDLGLMNLITTSDGQVYQGCWDTIKYFNKQIDKLKKYMNEHYPLIEEGGVTHASRNRRHYLGVIAKLYGVRSRKTNDCIHKITHDLSTTYDTVMVEDLQTKEMSETVKRGLNRAIRNVCFSKVIDQLSYKCKRVVKVNPKDTSKTCCKCGYTHKESLALTTREWTCPQCGTHLDRDRNAALNVLHLGRVAISMLYGGRKITVHDLEPYMWMDQNLYTAKELALLP